MAPDRTGLIHYRCATDEHQQGVSGRTADTLTVHEGKWAYCPMDVNASGHRWEETGGVAIETLRRGSPTINLDLDVRPHAGAAPRPSAKRPSGTDRATTPPPAPRRRPPPAR